LDLLSKHRDGWLTHISPAKLERLRQSGLEVTVLHEDANAFTAETRELDAASLVALLDERLRAADDASEDRTMLASRAPGAAGSSRARGTRGGGLLG
jgi:hypothetical protein